MALKTQPIVADVGSDLLDELLKQYNLLLAAVDSAADFAAFQAAVQAGVKKVTRTKNYPSAKHFPVK